MAGRTKNPTRANADNSPEHQLEVVAMALVDLKPTRVLDDRAQEIFQMIMDTRSLTSWKPYELHVATDLAELNYRLEWIKQTIEIEGDILFTRGGNGYINPRVTLMHLMQRESIALTRSLGLTAGQRSVGTKSALERGERDDALLAAARESQKDPLLA